MYIQAYFNTALQLVSTFKNDIPLTAYLKKYFSENKKHGSKDRKYISSFCYCFYRTGKLLDELNTSDKLTASIFLCSAFDEQLLVLFTDEWKPVFSLSLHEKLSFIQQLYNVDVNNVFPLHQHLTGEIDKNAFIISHLQQPDLFLRIRPNYHETVVKKLEKENIAFTQPSNNSIQLNSSFKADQFFKIDKEVVVQDLSSQSVIEPIKNIHLPDKQLQVWDVCAGSGGKSLLINDTIPDIHITATDIRPSIIHNLEQRFKNAGIKNYKAFVADISNSKFKLNSKYDLIICDVPCSGSGTWGRTPEQLSFFKEDSILTYQSLQKKIVTNAVKYLLPGSFMLYITCSVFKEENEEMVDYMLQHLPVTLNNKIVLKGYPHKADTMFAALFSFSK